MLTPSDNDLLCRVGPGTMMGDLMRQYWIPALIPRELPEADGPPIRLRLLGENLIAFRTTSGAVGLVVNACPHRGASMFFGRNEEEGLRCVYHGWKFNTEGACVDMPSEPPESNFKSKVRIKAYPAVERNNIIWAYMGPRETPPPLPEIMPNLEEGCTVRKFVERCNFMQALEGDIDTVHWGFLHAGHVRPEDCEPNSPDYFAARIRTFKSVVIEHAVGTTYGAVRPASDTQDNWRIGNFLAPFYSQAATGTLTGRGGYTVWVPLDDEHTMVWNIGFPQARRDPGATGVGGITFRGASNLRLDELHRDYETHLKGNTGRGGRQLPWTTDWIGRFVPESGLHDDFLIDRDLQRTIERDGTKPQTGTYTGVPGSLQDPMAQEGMGPIYDRTQEHLGTTDAMVIRTRRFLMQAARALREQGTIPPGVDQPQLYRMDSGGVLVEKGASGFEAGAHLLFQAEQWTPPVAVQAQVP
jgi:phenylpropionate dioxygenase-like ring-hydroxylating dioxygenase large terminal subunit